MQQESQQTINNTKSTPLIARVKTVYTPEMFRDYNQYILRGAIKIITFFIGFFIFMLVVLFFSLFQKSTFSFRNEIMPIIFMVIITILLIVIRNTWKNGSKKIDPKTQKMYGNGIIYSFYENYYSVEHATQYSNGQVNNAYSLIENVVETPEMFYVFIRKNEAYLLPKASFIEGNVDQFRAFLQSFVQVNNCK